MNKDMMKKIKTVLRKSDLIGVSYQPTLEECDYLFSQGISTTTKTVARKGLVTDTSYLVDVTNFVKE